MNMHQIVRCTCVSRLEMVRDVTERGLNRRTAAATQVVSVATVRKWLGPYLADGAADVIIGRAMAEPAARVQLAWSFSRQLRHDPRSTHPGQGDLVPRSQATIAVHFVRIDQGDFTAVRQLDRVVAVA